MTRAPTPQPPHTERDGGAKAGQRAQATVYRKMVDKFDPPGPVAGWREKLADTFESIVMGGMAWASWSASQEGISATDFRVEVYAVVKRLQRAMLAAAPVSALPPEPPVESGEEDHG